RELGVRYVVEGSVRRAGNRIRVTAQLIDARSGTHLWAERYDRDLEAIFAVQDELTQRVVASIAPRLQSEDTRLAKRKTPEDMRAYDHYLKAKVLVDTPTSIEDLLIAREHCDAAIALDPGYARAQAYKAASYVVANSLMEPGDIDLRLRQALESAERAVALDDDDNVCQFVLGEAAFRTKQYDRALVHMKRALDLNPNDADGLVISAYIQAAIGDPELAMRQVDRA